MIQDLSAYTMVYANTYSRWFAYFGVQGPCSETRPYSCRKCWMILLRFGIGLRSRGLWVHY